MKNKFEIGMGVFFLLAIVWLMNIFEYAVVAVVLFFLVLVLFMACDIVIGAPYLLFELWETGARFYGRLKSKIFYSRKVYPPNTNDQVAEEVLSRLNRKRA